MKLKLLVALPITLILATLTALLLLLGVLKGEQIGL